MTLQDFKATVLNGESMEFRPCFNNKEILRAKTSQGIVFLDAKLAKSKKPLYIESSYNEEGYVQYNLTDVAPTCVL